MCPKVGLAVSTRDRRLRSRGSVQQGFKCLVASLRGGFEIPRHRRLSLTRGSWTVRSDDSLRYSAPHGPPGFAGLSRPEG
jgi:hypothetical protein